MVVGIFEQGLGTSPVPYTEKTEVTGSDRTLASVGPVHPVRCSSEDAGVGQTTGCWVALRPDTKGLHPVVLLVSTIRSHSVTGRWQGPVKHDRTRPVGKNMFWTLTVNDRTLRVQRPVNISTVEIKRSPLNAGDTWSPSGDRTLRSSVQSVGPERPVIISTV